MSKASLETTDENISYKAFMPVVSRWLTWQCNMVSGVKAGAVFVIGNSAGDDLDMLAAWPEKMTESTTGRLHGLALDVMAGGDSSTAKVACPSESDGAVCDLTILPLRHNDELIGAMVFLQSVRSQEQKQVVHQLFQWGAAWLESTLSDAYDEQSQLDPLVDHLAKLALEDVPIPVAGYHVCDLLARQLECKRVALGLTKGLQVHMSALSQQLRFDHRSSNVREMEAAMEESIDQRESIYYSQLDEVTATVTQKHQALAAAHENASVLTIPLFNASEPIGAILLLRPRNMPFTDKEVKTVEYAVDLLGPIFALKSRDEDSLATHLVRGVKKRSADLLGAGHLPMKAVALGLVVVLSLLSLFKTPYDIYATSSLEGAIQQVIVAPQKGFVKTAEVRAGDRVEAGQLLVTLDDRDLDLQHKKLKSERDKSTKEYHEALALRERSKVSILSAQIAQVDAQLGLVDEKLKRSRLHAPFSGVVVSGDLSQSLGAPVEKGEQLFEIAREGDYRVAMSVDEHDVSQLEIAQVGTLRLVGLPYDAIEIKIVRITPVAAVEKGGNYFRVEAVISAADTTPLRPGMQGIARVEVGEGSLLWVLTHTLIERLRLWLWSIGL